MEKSPRTDRAVKRDNRAVARRAQRKYAKTAKGKATNKRYAQSAKGKLAKARYARSPKGRATSNRYDKGPQRQAVIKRYVAGPVYRATQRRWLDTGHGKNTRRITQRLSRRGLPSRKDFQKWIDMGFPAAELLKYTW